MTTAASSPQAQGAKDLPWTPIVTLMLWSGCLAIGLLGMVVEYDRPRPPASVSQPVQAEILHVELTSDPLPPESAAPTVSASAPPPLAAAPTPASAPPLMTVAEPSPAVAFALPVEGTAQGVPVAEVGQARVEGVATHSAVSGPALEALTFGQGDGRQPAPEYPRQARQSGQQGAVGVRFSVGPDGRVLEAEAVEPSPWPLLNAAAVRVVRERWRFRPGPLRLYIVSIRFQLEN